MLLKTSKVFEKEHLRFIRIFVVAGSGGASRGGYKHPEGIMEHKVIQILRSVSGDKSIFRQWQQNLTTLLGQVGGSHEEIVHRFVKEIDPGREREKVVTGPRADYGDEFERASGDVWSTLIDKAEMEACDKIRMVPKLRGLVPHGVVHRWLTDVCGPGRAEQARLMHRIRPRRRRSARIT